MDFTAEDGTHIFNPIILFLIFFACVYTSITIITLPGLDKQYRVVMIIVCAVCAIVPLQRAHCWLEYHWSSGQNSEIHRDNDVPMMDLDKYTELCGPHASAQYTNDLDKILTCRQLLYHKVNGTASVESVKLRLLEKYEVDIIMERAVTAGDGILCQYGVPYPPDCASLSHPAKTTVCQLNRERGMKCSIENLELYRSEISVVAPSTHQVMTLIGTPVFGDMSRKLRPGHRVSFEALVHIGWPRGSTLVLMLLRLQCVTCEDTETIYHTGPLD